MLRLVMALAAASLSATLAMAQTPADSRLKRITDSKSIKLGYRAAATPFSYQNAGQEPAGYTVDLCKGIVDSISKQLGSEIKIEDMNVPIRNKR